MSCRYSLACSIKWISSSKKGCPPRTSLTSLTGSPSSMAEVSKWNTNSKTVGEACCDASGCLRVNGRPSGVVFLIGQIIHFEGDPEFFRSVKDRCVQHRVARHCKPARKPAVDNDQFTGGICAETNSPAFKRSLRQFIGRPGIEETSRPGFTRSFPFFFEGTFLRSLQHFTFIITIAGQDTQAGQGVKVQVDFHPLAFHFAALEGIIRVFGIRHDPVRYPDMVYTEGGRKHAVKQIRLHPEFGLVGVFWLKGFGDGVFPVDIGHRLGG